jgi:hypothetical protein
MSTSLLVYLIQDRSGCLETESELQFNFEVGKLLVGRPVEFPCPVIHECVRVPP